MTNQLPRVTEKNYKASLVLAAITGVYMFGFWMGQQTLKEQYDTLKKQLDEKSEQVTTVVVTEYVDRVEEIVKWRTKNVEVIKLVPSVCELSDGWVHVHDSSAEGRNADSSRGADGTASGIKDTQALGTIVENYAVCHENAERLSALQKWITAQQQVLLNNHTAEAGSQEEQP